MSAMTPTPEARRAAAEIPWRARPGVGRRAPIRFFALPREEALTRAHPAVPFVLVTPLVGWLLDLGSRRIGAPHPLVLAVVGGIVLWTLVEYAMHRWLFHPRLSAAAPGWARLGMLMVHGHHHLVPDDPHRLVATPLQLGTLVLLVHGLLAGLLGDPWSGPALAGFLLGYLGYEALHFRAHHGRPTTLLGRALAGHHLRHHAGAGDDGRWGISTPLWDWVFRTDR